MKTKTKLILLFTSYLILGIIAAYHTKFEHPYGYPVHLYQEYLFRCVICFAVVYLLSAITLFISLAYRIVDCIKD